MPPAAVATHHGPHQRRHGPSRRFRQKSPVPSALRPERRRRRRKGRRGRKAVGGGMCWVSSRRTEHGGAPPHPWCLPPARLPRRSCWHRPCGTEAAALLRRGSPRLHHIHSTSQMLVLVQGWCRCEQEQLGKREAALLGSSAGLKGLGSYNTLLPSFPAYLLGCQLLKRAVAAALMALKLHSSPWNSFLCS